MPTTIITLVIMVFAILPGIFSYFLYKELVGIDWRLNDWEKIITIIGFSVFGLILYLIITSFIPLPKPIYIFPNTFLSSEFDIEKLTSIALAFLGHCLCAILCSLVFVILIKWLSNHSQYFGYTCAWDYFISKNVPNHWVIVKLISGASYAGILEYVDTSVSKEDRDIVLKEPALYVKDIENYRVIGYQQLYIPSKLICSIAVVPNADIEQRLTRIDSLLFPKDNKDERE